MKNCGAAVYVQGKINAGGLIGYIGSGDSEEIEIMRKNGENTVCRVESIKDDTDKEIESVPHPGQKVRVKLSEIPEEQDVLRRKEKITGE